MSMLKSVRLSICQVVRLLGCQVWSLGHAEQLFFMSMLKSRCLKLKMSMFFFGHIHQTTTTPYPLTYEFIELIHRKNTASSRKEPTLRLSQVVKDAIRKQLLCISWLTWPHRKTEWCILTILITVDSVNLVHTKQDRFSQKLVIDRALFLPNRNIYFDWSAKADPVGITDITIITLKGKFCVFFFGFFLDPTP